MAASGEAAIGLLVLANCGVVFVAIGAPVILRYLNFFETGQLFNL
jgi:hypothetical protein